ncbi:MAG TPA: DMT family transporter [Methylosinus sp.]|jgi:drug/metabolite transporter (DMT)-like permease|uniref:DMT family transporter n=1 Tax=Methylosinus sp. TaxID=427 RepID=UPI002F9232A0
MTSAPAWAWAAFTLIASGGQTLRNALQRDLTASLGAAGATFVRFLFGCPFSFLILAAACMIASAPPPVPDARTLLVIATAAALQIAATALMLASMRERSFVIVTALLKTEAVQIVVFGVLFLGEAATPPLALGVLSATFGVLALSLPDPRAALRGEAPWRPILYGLGSAALFGVSTVCYREGVLALGGPSFVVAAATELVLGLVLQTALILLYLSVFDRGGLAAILAHWRESLSAGLLGAFATLFWFLAFALETAPRVRTLALIEVLFAQMVTRRMFAQRTGAREWLGVAMLIAGVAAVLNGG